MTTPHYSNRESRLQDRIAQLQDEIVGLEESWDQAISMMKQALDGQKWKTQQAEMRFARVLRQMR